MSDNTEVDFRQWLCSELDRERQRTPEAALNRSTKDAIYLSELEATGLLFLALGIQYHAEVDRVTVELAGGLAAALYRRLLLATGSPVHYRCTPTTTVPRSSRRCRY